MIQSNNPSQEISPKVAIANDWMIFRLTAASRALGADVTRRMSDIR
jgi:hypothetical protein